MIAILAFAAGFGLGSSDLLPLGPKPQITARQVPESQNGTYEGGYQAGLDFAKKKLAEYSPFFGRDLPIHDAQATIKSIEDAALTLEFKASLFDIFKEGMLSKKATFSDKTVFERYIQKPMEDFLKESQQYNKAIQDYMHAAEKAPNSVDLKKPELFLPYAIIKIGLSDLKLGDTVSVRTALDMRLVDTFVADSVFVEAQPVPIVIPIATTELLQEVPPAVAQDTAQSPSPINQPTVNSAPPVQNDPIQFTSP